MSMTGVFYKVTNFLSMIVEPRDCGFEGFRLGDIDLIFLYYVN